MALTLQERRIIGPAEAAALLKYNSSNRRMREKPRRQYAKDMREGKWLDTGAPIIVYRNGNQTILEDGQTRLQAIIDSGCTFPMTVNTVDERVFDVLDLPGAGRTIRDLASIAYPGYPVRDVSTVANAVAVLDIMIPIGEGTFALTPPRDRIALLAPIPEQLSFGLAFHRVFNAKLGARWPNVGQMAGALHIYRKGGSAARIFLNRVATGEMLESRDPRLILRQMAIVGQVGNGAALMKRWHNLFVRAWNNYVENKKVSHLYPGDVWLNPRSPGAEQMPEDTEDTEDQEKAAD